MRGDTCADTFLISNQETGEAENLTGCTAKITLNKVKNPVDTSTQVYQLVGQMSDPTTGIIEFFPTEEQADLVGTFYFDIELTDTYNKKHTLVKDIYTYEQDITK